ncbi:beta-lactamase-like protein [Candidatus Koribacter versatilis Ellin345]|uniref:Beta-lactamase-like protein n=1 Tax=Koribacter versatilis (strain Ellin345) TaxID=204669 RepID=Q1IVQ6_KORVE|nr:MBL fold metallo-hydrolase [Candidatus Koribacter versatilis]ABF39044.1 beta-lactamase-like protein [Candidatus Koribacter versatilis Ellin345]
MNVPAISSKTHRTTIGDFELTILTDGTYWLDGGAMFGVVPKPLWSKRVAADDQNRITLGLNSLLIRGNGKNILVETGIGPKLGEKQQQIYGNQSALLHSFETLKLSPDDIDVVINTHLHFDHCGWNTYYKDGRATPTFPRATYYAQQGEWEHAQEQHDRDKVSYISDNYDPLINAGQMKLLKGDAEIAPGVRVKMFPGHTRNLQAVIIESQGKTACYISDLIPTSAHLDPTWVMGYDLDPILCIDNRKKFYDVAIPEKWLVAFTHDHEHPFAYVERDERGKPVPRYL